MNRQRFLIGSGALVVLIALAAWVANRWEVGASSATHSAAGDEHGSVRTSDANGTVYHTCAMHPQVRSDQPGNCPICGMKLIKAARTQPAPASGERKPLYWYDPMRPEVKFDKPGKSPFMDMDLVAKYAGEAGEGSISIDPRMVQNLGVRTTKVIRGDFDRRVAVVGAIGIDERTLEVVQSRADGWVERLHVRAVSDPVKRGQVLAEIYAPELYAAQQEYALAVRMAQGKREDVVVRAARQRLALLGVSERQLARLEKTGEAERRVTYYAPLDGFVQELGVREGQQVEMGAPLFKLAGLSHVWVTAEIPEAQSSWIAQGARVEAHVTSLTGERFDGRVDYVYPELNRETRTLRARIVLENKQDRLRPGMYATVTIVGGMRQGALLVPSEALIPTGERTVVIVSEGQGRFRPTIVEAGAEREGYTEILRGLTEDQEIVVSGQFLIDSEANLRGALARMESPPVDPGAPNTERTDDTPRQQSMDDTRNKEQP